MAVVARILDKVSYTVNGDRTGAWQEDAAIIRLSNLFPWIHGHPAIRKVKIKIKLYSQLCRIFSSSRDTVNMSKD
jgi:hypothetical protein